MQIRPLDPDDTAAFLALRLRALREHPEAYATSELEERTRPIAEHARRLRPDEEHVTLGAFERGRLVGMVGLLRPHRAKSRHRASIVAMYVAPGARRSGVGRALLERALETARAWGVSDVALGVTAGNEAARGLYAAAGFETYGVEPRSLFVEGRFHDVELMNLSL